MAKLRYHENPYDDPLKYDSLIMEDDRGEFVRRNTSTTTRQIFERLALWERQRIPNNNAAFPSKRNDWLLRDNSANQGSSTKTATFSVSERNFLNYINNKWLVPQSADDQVLRSKWICEQQDKDEIVRIAKFLGVCGVPNHQVTFQRVIRCLTEKYGYQIKNGRGYVDGFQTRYTLVVSTEKKPQHEKTHWRTIDE